MQNQLTSLRAIADSLQIKGLNEAIDQFIESQSTVCDANNSTNAGVLQLKSKPINDLLIQPPSLTGLSLCQPSAANKPDNSLEIIEVDDETKSPDSDYRPPLTTSCEQAQSNDGFKWWQIRPNIDSESCDNEEYEMGRQSSFMEYQYGYVNETQVDFSSNRSIHLPLFERFCFIFEFFFFDFFSSMKPISVHCNSNRCHKKSYHIWLPLKISIKH